MAITVTELTRAFRYNNMPLADPGAQFSAIQVRDIYSATYPEISTAAIEGPEEKDGQQVYTFRRAVGTKGMALDLRAHLEAIAAGQGPRPRGHAVTKAEYRAVYPLALACHQLAEATVLGGMRNPFEDDAPAANDGFNHLPAPACALPPLP